MNDVLTARDAEIEAQREERDRLHLAAAALREWVRRVVRVRAARIAGEIDDYGALNTGDGTYREAGAWIAEAWQATSAALGKAARHRLTERQAAICFAAARLVVAVAADSDLTGERTDDAVYELLAAVEERR